MHFSFGPFEIAVNFPTRASVLEEAARRFSANRGFALATLNLDHLVKLAVSDDFVRAYAAQDMIVADGNPIVWLSRIAGRKVDLVPGSDLVVPLAQTAARSGVSVALVGSTSAALERAAAHLREVVPGLDVAVTIAPPFGLDPHGEAAGQVLRQVAASGARLCFLALGAPRQEILAARGRAEVPDIGFACVGAGLDFLAGTQRRAPALLRRARMEWAWRATTSPLRLGPRYVRCLLVLPGHVRAALGQRTRRNPVE